MDSSSHCGGCGAGGASDECAGSFRRIGIIKVHWECWSDCNLACSFCYRTRGPVLSTEDGKRLISAVKTSGADTIVFAGGDPAIRPDICRLFEFAKSLGLKVEIQTNGHRTSQDFLNSIRRSDMVGLSLDGPDASSHDSFRDKPGNFSRVINLIEFLNSQATPVILRTVVSKLNYQNVAGIGRLVESMDNVVRWSLLSFSAVGEGYANRGKYEISDDIFESVVADVKLMFRGRAQLDAYRPEAKIGTYALVTPSGFVYGTGNPTIEGVFPVCGSILHDHLCEIAIKLPFSRERHLQRYGNLIQLTG